MRNAWNGLDVLIVAGIGCLGYLDMSHAAAGPAAPVSSVETLAHLCDTPHRLARFLRESIRLTSDDALFATEDYWQTPEEVLARRAGDCEDLALLAKAVLERQGVEAHVFSVYGTDGYAHTVCVFAEGGRYNVINQDRVRYYRAPTLEAVAGRLCPGWRYAAVAQRSGSRGAPVRYIWNSSPSSSHASPASDEFFSFP